MVWSPRNLLFEHLNRSFAKVGVNVSEIQTQYDATLQRKRYVAIVKFRKGDAVSSWCREVIEFTDDLAPAEVVKLIGVKLRLAGCSSISRLSA